MKSGCSGSFATNKGSGNNVQWLPGFAYCQTSLYAGTMNPLTVLPAKAPRTAQGPLVAVDAEMVGNYAIRIRFSDGHDTGICSWGYLREIDPRNARQGGAQRGMGQ